MTLFRAWGVKYFSYDTTQYECSAPAAKTTDHLILRLLRVWKVQLLILGLISVYYTIWKRNYCRRGRKKRKPSSLAMAQIKMKNIYLAMLDELILLYGIKIFLKDYNNVYYKFCHITLFSKERWEEWKL